MTDKALIEKAREWFDNLDKEINGDYENTAGKMIMRSIIGSSLQDAFIAGATWQREQLIKELREAREIIGELLATAKGYELEHRKDKLYTVRQRIERGEQFLAKLDLLEGEK